MTDPNYRTLAIMRHGKSAWDLGVESDHRRPLNERGRRAVPAVGRYMAEVRFEPDLVLCSTAVRTRQTLDGLLRDFAHEPKVRYERALYLATRDEGLERLRRVGQRWRRVLLIGHNPGLQQLATQLALEADRTVAGRIADKFPTAALALFDCALETWTDLSPASVRAVRFVLPKQLV